MPVTLEPESTVPVLVAKVGRYVIHHGAVGLVRSLGRIGVPVYAIVEDRWTPLAMSRYLAGLFVWKTEGLDTGALLKGFASIGEQLGRKAILIPTDDVAAAFTAENATVLQQWFMFPSLPRELPRRVTNKKELDRLCRSLGVPCPGAAFPGSIEDVYSFLSRAKFPVVVKVADTQFLPSGVRSTSIAHNPEELISIYRRSESAGAPNLIFQEYIPESSSEDWIYHGYSNPDTGCCIGFTGRKLRSYPPFAGITSVGVSTPNEMLRRQAERLLRVTSFAGIVDLDYRLDKRDGQYKLLDFNPRVGANFRMFEDAAGLDVVRALYLDLTGTPVHQTSPAQDRTFVVEPYDFFAAFSYMRHGRLRFRSWLRSLHGPREYAWFHPTDPVPFLMMWIRLVLQTVARAAARGRERFGARAASSPERSEAQVQRSNAPEVV